MKKYIEQGLSAKEVSDILNISASNFCFYIYNNFTITMNRKFENFKGFIQYRHMVEKH